MTKLSKKSILVIVSVMALAAIAMPSVPGNDGRHDLRPPG